MTVLETLVGWAVAGAGLALSAAVFLYALKFLISIEEWIEKRLK